MGGTKIKKVASILIAMLITMQLMSIVRIGTQLEIPSTLPQMPSVALVKLWSVTGFTPYMARFVEGDKYIIIFTLHGDSTWDGALISSWGDAYIFDVKSGTLLGKLTPDNSDGPGDTWEVVSWIPFKAYKRWNTSGFFSAFPMRMVEDVRALGTNAKVLDIASMTRIPIDWGFTDTNGNNFYATQLDYLGETLFVGHIASGTIYVFKYDSAQGMYVRVFSHKESGNYGRRVQMTLDGKIIVVGGLNYPYLDIWHWNGSTYVRTVHYQLPDSGGLGALGISDNWRVGYIIGGTYNGWVIIAYYNSTTKEFRVIYQAKKTGDGSWLYNPFYDRWYPEATEVFALCTRGAGKGVIYDVLTNTSFVVDNVGSGYAVAVSDYANYVFLGSTMYMVVKRDTLTGKPRIRFVGTFTATKSQELSSAITIEPPSSNFNATFYSGRITITKLWTSATPTTLITDPDIKMGRLSEMQSRGLVSALEIYKDAIDIKDLSLVPGTDPDIAGVLEKYGFTSEDQKSHVVTFAQFQLSGALHPYFDEGSAWYATNIHIPLNTYLDIYTSVKPTINLEMMSRTYIYDKTKRLLAIFGLGAIIGGGTAIPPRAYEFIMTELAARRYAFYVPSATLQTVSKITLAVGIATAVWSGIDALLVQFGGIGDVKVQYWFATIPTIVDRYGNKYAVIRIAIPYEDKDKADTYAKILTNYLTNIGYKYVGVEFYYPCMTWSEYENMMLMGYTPPEPAIDELFAKKFGYVEGAKLVGIDVMIITAVRAKQTFWEWINSLLGGGATFTTVTIVGSRGLMVNAMLTQSTITDPKKIVDLIGTVTINGNVLSLVPGANGAIANFAFLLGEPSINISFGERRGFFADIKIEAVISIEKLFTPLGNYGYTADLHYNWENTLVRLDRIEFVDMPYRMLYAERIFITGEKQLRTDITNMFELTAQVNSNLSPTGVFYHYITKKNVELLDPANGGIMQPCKRYIFNYIYGFAPNAKIRVYLNGTSITSTLPSHATVAISSNIGQNVKYSVTFSIKYIEGTEEKVLTSRSTSDEVHVYANSTIYRTYGISDLVAMTIEYMKSVNKPTFLEIVAKITGAEVNTILTDDEDRAIYYPPPLIPKPMNITGKFNVIVKVFEPIDITGKTYGWKPSEGARVEAYYGYEKTGTPMYTATTNASGIATFTNIEGGFWTFYAEKGNLSATMTIKISNDTEIHMYMIPKTLPQPFSPNYTRVQPPNVTITFRVYDAVNGTPIKGANITVIHDYSQSKYYGTVYSCTTDAFGECKVVLPEMSIYKVNVTATGYLSYAYTYLFDRDAVINIPLIPSTIVVAEYARLSVRVFYSDGRPYEGAHVEIRTYPDNTLVAAIATNSLGNATLYVPIGMGYNVSVYVYDRLKNRTYADYRIVYVTGDTEITFTLPWSSWIPPAPTYGITIYVYWKGEPDIGFTNAYVYLFNGTSGQLITYTDTRFPPGAAQFQLLPRGLYMVNVTAINPYNGSVWIKILWINLTEYVWIPIEVPWERYKALPHRLIAFAYDVLTGKGIEDVEIVVTRGTYMWSAKTNATGYAEMTIGDWGYYKLYAFHKLYQGIERDIIVDEDPEYINIPMSPIYINFTQIPPPPINGTEYPPIRINRTNYYWLSIQTVYHDGYPFSRANITIVNTSNNKVIAQSFTNGTGFVHFLIPANTTIKIIVSARNPQNTSQTFYAEKVVKMAQHYYFVFRLPWTSTFYAPEVMLIGVEFIVHRGQGYFYGNVSHLVLLTIWTNKQQNITVSLSLYNVTGGFWVQNKTYSFSLSLGTNVFYTWFSVNASSGGRFRVFANITKYQYDTDPTNNAMWSNEVYLKPPADFYVVALWRTVKLKQPWTILPDDIIEIDIGVYIPVNTSSIPLNFSWRINDINLTERRPRFMQGMDESVKTVARGMIWRNITIVVPWTSKIIVSANISHPYDDDATNNVQNITIEISPNIMMSIAKAPNIVREGSKITIAVNITSNIEPGTTTAVVSLYDNTTNRILVRKDVSVEPKKILVFETIAPQNSALWDGIRKPTETHTIESYVSGYDAYPDDNRDNTTITVVSNQWIFIIIAIIVIIAIIAVIARLVKGTVSDIVYSRYFRFVKRRGTTPAHTAMFISRVSEDEKRRFVKKKD